MGSGTRATADGYVIPSPRTHHCASAPASHPLLALRHRTNLRGAR